MGGGWSEPGLSLLQWESTSQQGEESRMIHVVTDYTWRYRYELLFSLYQYRLSIEIFIDVYIHKLLYTYLSLLCQLKGARSNDTPVAKTHLVSRLQFKIQYSNKRKWGKLILGPGQEVYQMSLEHLLVPKSREMLKKKKKSIDMSMSKVYRSQLKEFPMAKASKI